MKTTYIKDILTNLSEILNQEILLREHHESKEEKENLTEKLKTFLDTDKEKIKDKVESRSRYLVKDKRVVKSQSIFYKIKEHTNKNEPIGIDKLKEKYNLEESDYKDPAIGTSRTSYLTESLCQWNEYIKKEQENQEDIDKLNELEQKIENIENTEFFKEEYSLIPNYTSEELKSLKTETKEQLENIQNKEFNQQEVSKDLLTYVGLAFVHNRFSKRLKKQEDYQELRELYRNALD